MGELAKGLHVVEGVSQGSSTMNVVAVVEDDGAIRLIDCGVPGSGERIFSYLEKNLPNPPKIKTLVLTHFDADHAGAAAEIRQKTDCAIIAPEFDAKILSGNRFTNEELAAMLPEYSPAEIDALQRKIAPQDIPSVPVDRTLLGGELINVAGGARVIRVPGHTPGHIVLLLEKYKALITGDVLSAPAGRVGPPNPQYTFSPRMAAQSLKKLSGLEFEMLVPYHWPPLTSGGSRALRQYTETLS